MAAAHTDDDAAAAQLIQMLFPSKAGYYSGAWPQTQTSGYVDPQYAYAYAAQYGYTQPVSKMDTCLC